MDWNMHSTMLVSEKYCISLTWCYSPVHQRQCQTFRWIFSWQPCSDKEMVALISSCFTEKFWFCSLLLLPVTTCENNFCITVNSYQCYCAEGQANETRYKQTTQCAWSEKVLPLTPTRYGANFKIIYENIKIYCKNKWTWHGTSFNLQILDLMSSLLWNRFILKNPYRWRGRCNGFRSCYFLL